MAKKSPPPIEETFAALEAIVAKLENEQGDLKGSLDAFEEGVNRIKEAQRLLTEATQRVNQLTAGDTTDPSLDGDASE